MILSTATASPAATVSPANLEELLQAQKEMDARITNLDNILLKAQEKADEQVRKLANELSRVKDDNTSLNGRINILSDDNTSLNNRINILNKDNDSLRNQIEEQNLKITLLSEESRIVEGTLKTTQKTLEEKTKQIAEIQETLEKYEKEKQELSEKNTKLVNENAELVKEKEGLNALLEALRKEKADLENKEKAYQEEIEALSVVLDETLKCQLELEKNHQLEISEKTKIIAKQQLKCENYEKEALSNTNKLVETEKDRDEAKHKLSLEQTKHIKTRQKLFEEQEKYITASRMLDKEQKSHSETSKSLLIEQTARAITNQILFKEKAEHTDTKQKLDLEQAKYAAAKEDLNKAKIDAEKAQEDLINSIQKQLDEMLNTHEDELTKIKDNYTKLQEGVQAQKNELKKIVSRLSNINLQDPQLFRMWILDFAMFAGLNIEDRKSLETKISQLHQQLASPTNLISWKHLVLQFCNTLITTAIVRKVS
ncbi:hypothetical protein [Candidatus Protochlamydia amoebophila]|uniref:Uncharacterized protein n=1 Tax=Protochlamydia amoebophila (strain UWE25) TaxID=264201 RepID=Q6M9K2_PARUW|nr:hypothetical protein [Candidatus Protochlamydia amoebophila]CAF24747.1 unnamed protein product [Candidatus Protochlamydia amoebophila UWE25]